MLRVTRHGDVSQLEMSCQRGRMLGVKVNAFLVRGVLIDSGYPRAGDDLATTVDARRLRGAMITHMHEDHAGNVPLLASRGIPLAMARETWRVVQAPPPIGLYRRWAWGTPVPSRAPVSPFADDALLLVPTPGHSRDHHVVWDAAEGTVFGGDLFLGVKSRLAHPGEDIRGSVTSLRRVIALGPERYFDAHRGLIPDPAGALSAKVQWLEDTIGAIDTLVRSGATEERIFRDVMGREHAAGLFSQGDYSRRNFVRAVVQSGDRVIG